MLELETLGFQHRVDQIEDVETDPAAVYLGENVADLIYLQVAVKLDVGDLVLLGEALEMLSEGVGVVRTPIRLLRCAFVAVRRAAFPFSRQCFS